MPNAKPIRKPVNSKIYFASKKQKTSLQRHARSVGKSLSEFLLDKALQGMRLDQQYAAEVALARAVPSPVTAKQIINVEASA